MVEILRLQNYPINSCCYVVFGLSRKCIIIDPGSESNEQLYKILEKYQLDPEFILLTHEHFDHTWGVNSLRERYANIKLVCTVECNEAIQRSKGNCSVFYDNTKAFEISPADITMEQNQMFLLCGNIKLKMLRTPGHTSGCMSIIIGDNIFTGDALIPGFKTITKLPNASIKDQIESESFFKTLSGFTIYPGHELPVKFDYKLFKWLEM